jgi:hypothetical protein
MRVVRILSVLPGAVGVLCLLIGGISVYGIDLDTERVQIPVVPCTEVSDEGCLVGMTGSDLEVPAGFLLMDIELTIEWSEPSKSWIGVVDASYADSCPPDGDGLTACTKDDFEFISGGPDSQGNFKLDLQPDSYRFVSAGKEGADLDEQLVTISPSVGIAPVLELPRRGTLETFCRLLILRVVEGPVTLGKGHEVTDLCELQYSREGRGFAQFLRRI